MKTKPSILVLAGALTFGAVPTSLAHCDSLDGPVIVEARTALSTGDLTPVLKWVRADDEAAIRAAFAQSRDVRKLSPAAAELADRFFFETLVRIHRAGEGEPFTGLKAAGSADAALLAADRAIDTGDIDALVSNLTGQIGRALRERHAELQRRREHRDHNVEAGRAFVASYVQFIHLYEQFAALTASAASGAEHKHGH